MKVLHLTLKKKWFDMILSGEKKEEYREIKDYWISRLVFGLSPEALEQWNSFNWKGGIWTMESPMDYDIVQFTNGYSKGSPSFKIKIQNIEIKWGKEKWGAEFGKPYFVISLGEIVL